MPDTIAADTEMVTPAKSASRTWCIGLQGAVLLVVALNALLVGRRLLSVFTPWDPALMPVTTSGCEEEALFSLWKFVQGQPVYTDPGAIPYAVSYFNWLFYWLYGGAAKLGLSVFSLEPAWLPVIARGLTLILTVGCAVVTYAIVREAGIWPRNWRRVTVIGLISLLFFNELFREWIVTTRPDVGGLFFELMGLWFALRYFNRPRWITLAATLLCCYAAWSFKHNMVSVITGFCLVLLLTRRIRECAFMAVGFGLLAGAAFAIGGATYRFSILASQKHCTFSFDQCWYVLRTAFDLASHWPILVVTLLAAPFLRQELFWDSRRFVLCAATAVAWILMFVTAAKHGSDYNYVFLPSVLGALWVLGVYSFSGGTAYKFSLFRLALPLVVFFMGVLTLRTVAVAIDEQRIRAKAEEALTSRQQQALDNFPSERIQLQRSLAKLPGPVLVTDRHHNLPWIQPHAPQFVVAYGYPADRQNGQIYEGGGIAGLLAAGYFKTVVTPAVLSTNIDLSVTAVTAGPTIDGQSLDRYEVDHSDRYFTYYRVRP